MWSVISSFDVFFLACSSATTPILTSQTPTIQSRKCSLFPSDADPFPICGRDLPQVVRQLSHDASSSDKRFGPSSVPVESFPSSMRVPLVGKISSGHSIVITPQIKKKFKEDNKRPPSRQRHKTEDVGIVLWNSNQFFLCSQDGCRISAVSTNKLRGSVKSRSRTWSYRRNSTANETSNNKKTLICGGSENIASLPIDLTPNGIEDILSV